MIIQREAAQIEGPLVTINPLVINAIGTTTTMKTKLMYIEMRVNSHQVYAIIDTVSSHVFIAEKITS